MKSRLLDWVEKKANSKFVLAVSKESKSPAMFSNDKTYATLLIWTDFAPFRGRGATAIGQAIMEKNQKSVGIGLGHFLWPFVRPHQFSASIAMHIAKTFANVFTTSQTMINQSNLPETKKLYYFKNYFLQILRILILFGSILSNNILLI
jgi:hypothetical protein